MVKKQEKKVTRVDIHPVYGIMLIIIVTAIATTVVNFIFWQLLSQ